jgi:hypothetical protein
LVSHSSRNSLNSHQKQRPTRSSEALCPHHSLFSHYPHPKPHARDVLWRSTNAQRNEIFFGFKFSESSRHRLEHDSKGNKMDSSAVDKSLGCIRERCKAIEALAAHCVAMWRKSTFRIKGLEKAAHYNGRELLLISSLSSLSHLTLADPRARPAATPPFRQLAPH